MLRKLVTATVLASVAILPFAGVGAAAGPTISTDRNMVLALEDQACAGLGVSYDILMRGREVVQDFGDLVRVHTTWRGEIVASDGTDLRVLHAWSEVLDLADDTRAISGMPFGTRVEASSLRVHDRGRLIIDLGTGAPIFMAGKFSGPPDPHQWTCDLIAAAS